HNSNFMAKLGTLQTSLNTLSRTVVPLKRDFIGAKIDNDLFLYLTIPEFRDEIRQLLNDIFLTDTSASFSDKIGLLSLICILCTVA
ncbi:hypothetical protein, partial [Barnesiella sp. CU968]|uniref:hypothetical protein n=1 Tax=Barnesiella sp. CU968 TaxID=2780099 RepID=UPI001958320B